MSSDAPETHQGVRGGQHFDAAALGAAALAGALAVLLPKGPFDWMSATVGLTLLSLIVAYEMDRRRTRLQSLALATVAGLVMLLVLGLILELILGHGNLDGVCKKQSCDVNDSRVPTWLLALS